jgi:hypothetical protein
LGKINNGEKNGKKGQADQGKFYRRLSANPPLSPGKE